MTRFILLVLALAAAPASAQYPNKPIRLIVPAAPGGGTDIVTRSVTPAIAENLGQNMVLKAAGVQPN